MFNRVFHCKSSILEHPYFWKHPYHDHLIAKNHPRFLSAFNLPGLSEKGTSKIQKRIVVSRLLLTWRVNPEVRRPGPGPKRKGIIFQASILTRKWCEFCGGSTLPFKQNRIMVWWLYGKKIRWYKYRISFWFLGMQMGVSNLSCFLLFFWRFHGTCGSSHEGFSLPIGCTRCPHQKEGSLWMHSKTLQEFWLVGGIWLMCDTFKFKNPYGVQLYICILSILITCF